MSRFSESILITLDTNVSYLRRFYYIYNKLERLKFVLIFNFILS
jgi:hypothetical protein